MIETVTVQLGERGYPVWIGAGARFELKRWLRPQAAGRQVVVIADETVSDLHLAALKQVLPSHPLVLEFHAGENSKSISTAAGLLNALAAQHIERKAVILTFGGGVAGDLGGFVAAIWLRGVDFVQVPTSLLAAVDASVGGKTGVNLAAGKNMVGAFHQPRAVVVDTDFLQTLPDREFRAGLAESVKHAAIQDLEFFAWHEANADAVLSRDAATVAALIARDVAIKAAIVAMDEREEGWRAVLNYGHTVGHALEHLLDYDLRHGECVALGMRVENELSCARGLPRPAAERLVALLDRYGLPVRLPRPVDPASVVATCRADKKVTRGQVRFVLLRDLGQPVLDVTDVTEDELMAALEVIEPDGGSGPDAN